MGDLFISSYISAFQDTNSEKNQQNICPTSATQNNSVCLLSDRINSCTVVIAVEIVVE